MADPRRIVQARSQLHIGQLVKYWDWGTGKLREARIAAMKDRQVTLLDEQSKQRFSVLYAAVAPVDEHRFVPSVERLVSRYCVGRLPPAAFGAGGTARKLVPWSARRDESMDGFMGFPGFMRCGEAGARTAAVRSQRAPRTASAVACEQADFVL
jgi:hypothetical protein